MVATSISLPNAAMVASSASVAPLVATITGSNTIGRSGCSCLSCSSRCGDLLGGEGAADHADLDRIDADIARPPRRSGRGHLGRDRMDRADAQRVLRGDRGDRGHRVAAEHGDGLDVGLDPRAAAGIGPGDDQDCAAVDSAVMRRSLRGEIVKQPRPPRRCRRPAARPCAGSSPSAMTRISGSVPDLRITSRPRPPSSLSAAAMRCLDRVGLERRAAVEADILEQLRHRLELRAAARSPACPASTSAASTCSPATSPSPVVAWSVRMMWPDCSPPTLQPHLAHRLEHIAVADLGADAGRARPRPASARARGWTSPSRRSPPPLELAAALAADSAISAISWSPSTSSPFSSTTISRSASPSSARPMSAP